MSKIKKIKVNNVNYDLGVDYSNVDNKPDLSLKQDTLVSGTNIKTINNQSILGEGNINIEGGEGGTSELSTEVKNAILDCFENVAWVNDQGQTYYNALSDLLFPPKELVSISAVFNQGSATIYSTDTLDSLKQYLTVTATYDDSTTETITNYTLSGTLTVGTSTITVSYGGKTDTFNVVVSQPVELSSITATYTQSGTVYTTDTLDSLKNDLVVIANYTDSSTRAVTDYTLSGSLTAGTSTITVSYSGKTTTFTVVVTTVAVTSIDAVFTQGSATITTDNSLDDLKQYLTVTANYNNGTTSTVASTDYTLSGTLAVGTSTITVTYESKTDTFDVTVTEATGNLFDPTTATVLSIFTANATGASPQLKSSSSPTYGTAWCEVEPNKTYTITKDLSNSFRIGTTETVPATGVNVLQTDVNHSATTMTITTNANAHYLYFTYWLSGNASYPSEEPIRQSIVVMENN